MDYDLSILFNCIDKKSQIPLYKQVELALENFITKEPYASGAYLPGENELIKNFRLSRHTVRQALDNLVRRGIITREQGRGSRKTPQQTRIYTKIEAWHSFTAEMNEQGLQSQLFMINTGVQLPPYEAAMAFQSPLDLPLAYLFRRYGYKKNNQTDIYFESYFNPRLYLDRDPDFLSHNFVRLYDFLEQKKGVSASESQETIEVVFSENIANLEITKAMADVPILKRVRVVADQDGLPLEYNIGYYRSDVFSFKFNSSSIRGV